MRQIHLEGETIKISERDFHRLVGDLIGAVYLPTKYLHGSCASGFPDVSEEWKLSLQKELGQLQAFIPQIDDQELRELLHSLEILTRKVEELNAQFVELTANFFALPIPRTRQERQELTQRMNEYKLPRNDYWANQPEYLSWNPIWANQPEYRQLVERSEQVFDEWERIKMQIYHRQVSLILAIDSNTENAHPTSPDSKKRLAKLRNWDEGIVVEDVEFGDEQAKDLVDMAVEEPDPKKASKLLHQALSYGHTGIQASKAYLELGARSEDLGDTVRAISYYTKSIEAYKEPLPMALYWRGKLYYQQKRWDEARNDFGRALSLGLFSPEHEWAQMYLSKLNHLIDEEGEPDE
jgi:tetratricopeptide (TPR) repeat protein